jgi:hypothetical protein
MHVDNIYFLLCVGIVHAQTIDRPKQIHTVITY